MARMAITVAHLEGPVSLEVADRVLHLRHAIPAVLPQVVPSDREHRVTRSDPLPLLRGTKEMVSPLSTPPTCHLFSLRNPTGASLLVRRASFESGCPRLKRRLSSLKRRLSLRCGRRTAGPPGVTLVTLIVLVGADCPRVSVLISSNSTPNPPGPLTRCRARTVSTPGPAESAAGSAAAASAAALRAANAAAEASLSLASAAAILLVTSLRNVANSAPAALRPCSCAPGKEHATLQQTRGEKARGDAGWAT